MGQVDFICYLGPTQSRWIPLVPKAIKLNADDTWDGGISSMIVITRNHEVDVMDL